MLAKLLKSKDPKDLMKANKLIKKMADEVGINVSTKLLRLTRFSTTKSRSFRPSSSRS